MIGIVTTLIATEPEQVRAPAEHAAHAGEKPLTRVVEAAVGAFADFLTRDMALVVLAFVVLFKFTDAFAGAMTAPFVIDLGFTRNEYAAIVKGVGLAATLIGGFAGGFVARAYPLADEPVDRRRCCRRSPTSRSPGRPWSATTSRWLTFAIIAENFTSAIGTVIFVAYLSALCQNPLHTATQYALLTALAAVGRTYLSSGAGFVAEATGWVWFFVDLRARRPAEPVLLWWLQRARAFRHSSCRRASRSRTSGLEPLTRCERQNGVRCRIAADSVPSSR